MMDWLKKLILFGLLILVIQSKKPDYNIKFNEIEQRITNDDLGKYITAQEFVKLMADNFAVSLK